MFAMKYRTGVAAVAIAILVLFPVIVRLSVMRSEEVPAPAGPVAALSVVLTRPQTVVLPVRVPATGNVAPWQEASIGSETEGLKLTEVRVNVGDAVLRGQVLATFDTKLVNADLAEARAEVAVAGAQELEADANARRARKLEGSGAMSLQQIDGYVAAAAAARARLEAARAVEQRHRVRLAHTRLVAPSDGIVTSRTATVGAVLPSGQELFRIIKDGRLEWRAAVAVSDLDAMVPGQEAYLQLPGQPKIPGVLRMVAPDINTQTHSGLVYVDLPRGSAVRAGAFATGYVEVGKKRALTLPHGAVLLRDGFHYVMQVGPAANVVAKKVAIGRRVGDRIEITAGLVATEAVIASGLSFLSEGDTVHVVDARESGAVRADTGAGTRSAP